MAEKITVYQCPACTGPLHFDGKIGKLKCDYCGGTYTVEEAKAYYESKNKEAAAADLSEKNREAERKAEAAGNVAAAGAEQETGGWGADAVHMRAYSCTSCGADLLCDDTTAASSCPYCGNPTIIPGKFDGKDRPDYVIPFKVEKKEAVEALKGYYKGRFLLPGSFVSGNHIEEIKGVYVPFWMFSGEVSSDMQFDARKIQKTRSGDTETTTTEYYDVKRSGKLKFHQIPVDAATKMPDDLMDSIEPFDYKGLKPFAMEYLPGYMANKYDVSKEICRERAHERAVNTTHSAIRNTVKNYESVNTVAHKDEVTGQKTEYGMLPVWLLNTKWEGKDFLFAMNGQSGKMTGDLPVSKGKLAGIAAAVFAVIFALMNFVVLHQKGDSVLISVIAALIVAGITAAVMRSSMKPVAKSTSASGYVLKEDGLQILSRSDRFLRREQTSKQIPKSTKETKPGPK